MKNHRRLGLPRAHLAVLALAVALGLLACAMDGGNKHSWKPVAPQQWQDARGPVVPHDTFPRDCSLCHEGQSWHVIRDDFVFDHAQETGVPLLGAHAQAECLRCHNDRGPVAQFAQQGCSGCHEDVHFGKLGDACTVCHLESAVDWRPKAAIAEHALTRFPLAGAHASAACWACHPGAQVGNFDRASTECIACHADDLARAVNPDHQAQGWTDNCQRCHLPTDWSEAGFEHGFFPLQGGHDNVNCAACHPGNVFTGTPTACFACHQDDYRATTDPNHAFAGFPTTCEQCHTIQSWEGAKFDHTSFPLNGAHVGIGCNACHGGGVYRGTPSACFACHQDDYKGARDHVSGNFPTTCQDCHTTSTWRGGDFSHRGISNGCSVCHLDDYQATTRPDHETGGFPTTCESCHQTSTWEGASFNHGGITSGCVVCHMDDWQSTTQPNHAANGISTTCELCHNTRSWGDGSFTHTQFPITGDHGGLSCQQCHPSRGSFQQFTCTSCHAHNQRDMNDEHDRVRGYVYESNACYSCHPNGQSR